MTDEKKPEGCVERHLNVRERNILIGACREFCKTEGRGDYKNQNKLMRVSKLVKFEETIEFFDELEELLDARIREWKKQKLQYMAYSDYKAGLMPIERLKSVIDGFHPENPPGKPPTWKTPELTPDERRGPTEVFYIPSRLDAWIQDALKVYKWEPLLVEFNVELCEKFGIKDED